MISGMGRYADEHYSLLVSSSQRYSELGPSFKSEMPDPIKKANKELRNVDPRFLVATRDYKCLLCKRKHRKLQTVKAGEFHYHLVSH